MIKIVVFKSPQFYSDVVKTKRDISQVDENYLPKFSSLQRTKMLVRDIVLCNGFDYFCTFTFNPKKCNSYSFPSCWSKMSAWLHHQRDNSREQGIEFKYLIIPEQHKSGRWHFHALISGYIGSLRPANCLTASDRPIYNMTSFRSGFTTAVAIDNQENVANYVTKYITKEFIKMFNQRRFFCSRNLVRPVKSVNSSLLSRTLPLFRRVVADDKYSRSYVIDSF